MISSPLRRRRKLAPSASSAPPPTTRFRSPAQPAIFAPVASPTSDFRSFCVVRDLDRFISAFLAPRSGLAWKHSIVVDAGVIDADYRGLVGVILFNHSDVDFEVKTENRVAQLIIKQILTTDVAEVEDLDSTVRGAGVFGSTGV